MSQIVERYGALRREHVLCPVTALSFYRAQNGRVFILSGEDSQLKVYDVETSTLCATVPVFRAQCIHGIFVRTEGSFTDGATVLVWGGSSVAVLSQTDIESLLAEKVLPSPIEVHAPDWIYDGVLSPSDRDLGAIITAHNEVIPLLLKADGKKMRFGRLRSPSRPILYSAKLAWESDDSLIVGAGTAFGEIVVWKCGLHEGAEKDDCEIIYVFSGHEGSIFGVDITPEVTLPSGVKTRLLASCSDDRTIRIWDLTELRKDEEKNDTVSKTFSEARETGFGSTYEDAAAGPQHLSKPVAVVMSHLSRIWHVRFAVSTPEVGEGSDLILYSFGEDATTQRWQLQFTDFPYRDYLEQKTVHGVVPKITESLASLNQLATYHSHSGKHIWSAAIHTEGCHLVTSGGSDGMINLIGSLEERSSSSTDNETSSLLSFSVPEILETLSSTSNILSAAPNGVTSKKVPTKTKRSKLKDVLNQYAFLSEDQILTTTLSGKILVCRLLKDALQWSEIEIEEAVRADLASWQVARSIGGGNALLGSASGSIYIYDTKRIRKIAQVGGKVADLLCLSDSLETGVKVLATILGRTKATLFHLKSLEEHMSPAETFIELDQGFIVTSATFCNMFLVLGSRFGAILVYAQQEASFERVARIEAQTKDAVASITSLPTGLRDAPSYFLTACRDGKYRIYEISSSAQYNVSLRHESSPPLGPMIEGSYFISGPNGKPELILCGFRSKYFIVWNETRHQELASVECGGAHRAFTYRLDPRQPERLCFIWTQASQTCIYRQQHVSHRPLRAGGHGREIRPVSSCGDYLATAAEDTAIRIWKYESEHGKQGNKLRCLAVLEKHNAGIQCLKWLGNSYLISSAGNEELFIWKVTTLQSAYEGLAVVCEAAYPDQTLEGDLRITNFDVQRAQGVEETRMYMTLTLSNSTIRTYEYSKIGGFKLLSKGKYTGACMMQIRHLHMSKESLHVLAASTDGHVAIWKANQSPEAESLGFGDYSLIATAHMHQSSVKALDLRYMGADSSTWFVVTGGDDNSLGTFTISWDITTDTFVISKRSIVKSVHAAALTGLSIAEMSEESALVVTASDDQRVKTWHIELQNSGESPIVLLENRYSSIADTGDLELLGDKRLVIVGVGMEFWKL